MAAKQKMKEALDKAAREKATADEQKKRAEEDKKNKEEASKLKPHNEYEASVYDLIDEVSLE